MLKKIIAVLMAAVLALGILTVAVSAEETEEPAYTPVTYSILDILDTVEAGGDFYLNPTDIIELPVKAADPAEPDEPAAAEEEPPVEEPTDEKDAYANILIVEYLPGDDATSPNKITKFSDLKQSGYAIKGSGDYTDFAYENVTRKTNYFIDYKHPEGYAFKRWRVTSVYSGKEFSRLILEAEWDVPVLTGWAGFMAMRRANIKLVIDYIIQYLIGLFNRIAAFLV